MHWGKMFPASADAIRRMYDENALKAWLIARDTLLPSAELRQLFSSPLTDQLEL
jgi:hypothetical protein